jgi:histidine ammonia-lyase
MGTVAARQAATIIANVQRVVAIELLCAAEALEYRSERPGEGTRKAHAIIRSVVPRLKGDRMLSDHIEAVTTLVREGAFTAALTSLR